MTILSYGTTSGDIMGLWVLMAMISGFLLVVAIIFGLTDEFTPKIVLSVVLCVVLLAVGILGLCFWTPHYNTIKVYNNKNFQIESVMEKYDIIATDGYIITLQEKEPIK